MTRSATAPANWQVDVVLDDGATAHLRPVRPDDLGPLRGSRTRLSQQDRCNRSSTSRPALSGQDLADVTQVDHRDGVATLHGRIMGVVHDGRVACTDEAEVALVVGLRLGRKAP